MDMELPRRNGKAVEEALREMTKKIEEQQKRIDGLNAALATLVQRIQIIENQQAIQRIKALGTGPTA